MSITIDKQVIWESTFGTSGESFSWWREVTFIEGDWDTPGRVRLGIEDPDDDRKTVTRVVTIEDVLSAARKASRTCVDACTGSSIDIHGDEIDWDACVSDCVMQIAVLGKVVFG